MKDLQKVYEKYKIKNYAHSFKIFVPAQTYFKFIFPRTFFWETHIEKLRE